MTTATRVLNGGEAHVEDSHVVHEGDVRVEVRELNQDGDGSGEVLGWESTDALRRPRITFKVSEKEARRLLRQFCETRRPPIYELSISDVLGYELPPVGSLGWTAGRG